MPANLCLVQIGLWSFVSACGWFAADCRIIVRKILERLRYQRFATVDQQ